MALEIKVISAANLQNLETLGKSDPYVTIIFQGDKQKTEVKPGTLEPIWEETLKWDISSKPPRADECIDITVKDYERLGRNKLLGKATIALRNVVHAAPGTPLDYELGLLDSTDTPTVGTLKLVVSYKPPGGVAKGGGGKMGGNPTAATSAARAAQITATDMGADAMLIPDIGVDGVGGATMPQIPQQRNRDRLSTVQTKFQVRVRIVEGRQLLGSNMNPVCRVCLDGKARQTRVHKGTNTPWFDEIFFFQVEKVPSELMEDFLEFKVCNSRGIRASSVIGAFKCEIGMVYDQIEHAVLNRWLVLANPDEPTPTVQGYLKVSVAVLGPGDLCPDLSARQSDLDDVEANLLWSAGVHLQPATFVLSVYCAQNLPRMDAGTMQTLKQILGVGKPCKELVDPYLMATYAGREVQTKILYTNENPEFRQNLYMGFLFPSMCNVIKITLKDWDRVGDDDTIGTADIPVSAISAPGDDGYLPTFGPAWVNVYGARREWELMEGDSEDKMNKGRESGCAYRGRVLLALHTQVGSYPPAPTTSMENDMFVKVRRFRGTRKFVALCQLSGAWLLGTAGKPLEIEVSVGNFGNKLENSMMPSPSSTHPANPVFDGCKYYFLPWSGAEPFVTVHCDFEDVTHRLHAVNHITSIITIVKHDIERLESLLRGHRQNENSKEVQDAVQQARSRLITACSQELPTPDPVRHTETSLDTHLRSHRAKELKDLCADVQGWSLEEPNSIIGELQSVLNKLEALAQDPQSSIPDVFLWLMSGTRRMAYVRIPAHSVLAANDQTSQGILAGNFNTYSLTDPEDETGWGIGGVVRASVWLGREEDVRIWWDSRPHLQLTVFAETYENQTVSAPGTGKWSDSGLLMKRPKYSDADGRLSLPRESFSPPDGWKFQGDWVINPDPSVQFEADAGRQVFTEEVFEQGMRLPGGAWIPAAANPWADARGDPATPRDEINLPRGWAWRDVWTYDLQRAVDGEGWEYTMESGLVGWSPQEKIYHVRRRRRWIRERHLVEKIAKKETAPVDGWEYAPLFIMQFHALERKVDMVRRRRWRRRLVPSQPGLPPTPLLSVKAGEGKDDITQLTCPRMYVETTERHMYQLRAHLYQARDLPAGDKTGLSDPYAVVSFCNGTQQTDKQSKTLCPTWDQTLIFDDVGVTGPLTVTTNHPPKVVVEIYDWDARGAPEFLGRVFCSPNVIDPKQGYEPRPLKWFPLARGPENQGELLGSFELLVKDSEELPMLPPTRGDFYMVPFGVRPRLQRTRIEVLCWGVRNMETYELQSVTRPSIEFECGGERVTSPIMANLKLNPNFDKPHLVFDVELPKEELYMPPLTLRVVDHRAFGSKPVVATAVVSDLHKYTVEPKTTRKKRKGKRSTLQHRDSYGKTTLPRLDAKLSKDKDPSHHRPTLSHQQASREPGTVDSDIDWWAKFYVSCGQMDRAGSYLTKGYEKLEVMKGCLEDEGRFAGFTDLVDTVPLFRGRVDQALKAGEFKGTFRIYPLSTDGGAEGTPSLFLSEFPSPEPLEVVARVYVVLGQDLAPKDAGGASDPYVIVKLGKSNKSSKDDYRANTLNPIFGHVFEVQGTLPLHKDLKIEVWDHDMISTDDLIGETSIDLENRFLTRHRATVGLPRQYHVSGTNMWRDSDLPTEILNKMSKLRNIDGPVWNSQPLSVTLGGATYTLTEFESPDVVLPASSGDPRERLALHVLHRNMSLVPEHVETRTLTHPANPGIPQGCIKMWVDIFPAGQDLPPPVDISPRRAHKYLLRVVVYNVYEAPLEETSIVSGEKMSDVYVKGWLQGTAQVQKTDIHYRCMEGDANFNWRLVFPIEVIEAEQVMLVEYKEHPWSVNSTTIRRPPHLTLQLWDNDLIMSDDYLSETTLDLCRLPKPAKRRGAVGPSQVPQMLSEADANSVAVTFLDDDSRSVNLFEAKRVYGFFPFTRVNPDGVTEIAGKIEMEMEVVSEEEAKERPAGHGRDEPNMNPKLPEPNRPATSFLWITSPLKSFKHIIWKRYKWYCITLIVLFLMLLFLLLFFYSLPSATVDYMLGTY